MKQMTAVKVPWVWGAAGLVCAVIFFVFHQLSAEVIFRKAVFLEKNFDWDEALTGYQRAIQYAPWFADYNEAAARLAEKRAKVGLSAEAKKEWYQKAILFYDGAARKHPYWAANYYRQGAIYQELKNTEKAGVYFSKAVALDPTRDLYVAAYAYWYLNQGKTREAVKLFRRLQDLPFREMPGLTTEKILGDIYKQEKNTEVLKGLLTSNWRDAYALAHLLGRDGRWDEALPYFDEAVEAAKIEMRPADFMPHFGAPLAQFFVQNGRGTEACHIYEKFVEKGFNDQASLLRRNELCGAINP